MFSNNYNLRRISFLKTMLDEAFQIFNEVYLRLQNHFKTIKIG